MEYQKLSCVTGENVNWSNHFGKSLVITTKFVLHIFSVPVISPLECLRMCVHFRELCAHMQMCTIILIAVSFAIANN